MPNPQFPNTQINLARVPPLWPSDPRLTVPEINSLISRYNLALDLIDPQTSCIATQEALLEALLESMRSALTEATQVISNLQVEALTEGREHAA